MLVVCTGMVRSGSTWSFNVVKQLLLRTGRQVRSGYADAVGDALLRYGEDDAHVVIKSHTPDRLSRALIKQGGCRTVYTYRQPLEVILSLSPRDEIDGGFNRTAQTVKESLELMRFQVEAGGVRFVWYGDIVERGRDVVQAIADYLELVLDPQAISEVADGLSRENVRRIIKQLDKSASQIKVGESNWDGSTLFSSGHISDNPTDPATVFSRAQVARIAAELGDHVDASAALRPAIRAIGMLDQTPPRHWPPVEPPQPEPEAEPVAAEPAAADAPAAAAPNADVPPPPEPPLSEAEPPEAPAIDAADDEPPEAPAIDTPASPPPKAPAQPIAPIAAAPAKPPAASKPPAAAKPAAVVKPVEPRPAAAAPVGYNPVRDAARRALARDLMSSLGYLPRGKPRPPAGD